MRRSFVLALALAACGKPQSRTLAIDVGDGPIQRVDLRVEVGTAEVSGASGATGEAILSWRGDVEPEVTSRLVGGTLLVTASCPDDSRRCQTDVTMQIPAMADLDVTTSEGKVTVTDMDSAVDLVSRAGDVSVSNCTDDLRVDVVVGDLELFDLSARVEGTVSAGDTTGLDLTSPTLQLVGEDGEIDLTFDAQPELVEISTERGNVRLRMPRGDYDIDVATRTGTPNISDVTNTDDANSVVIVTSEKGDITISSP